MRRKRVRLTAPAAGMNMHMGAMGMNMGAMGMNMGAMGSGGGMGGMVGMGMIPPAWAMRGRTMMQNPMAGSCVRLFLLCVCVLVL